MPVGEVVGVVVVAEGVVGRPVVAPVPARADGGAEAGSDAAAESGGILNGGKFDLAMYAWVSGSDPDDSSQWTCDAVPPAGGQPRKPWQKDHEPNFTGTDHAYRPPGHTLVIGEKPKPPYEAWRPG